MGWGRNICRLCVVFFPTVFANNPNGRVLLQVPVPRREEQYPEVSTTARWYQLALISLVELLVMTLWFSASAVVPQLRIEWALGAGGQSWLTMSVQLGFVAGALASAVLNLADRVPVPLLLGVSALAGSMANAAIPFLDVGFGGTVIMRFLTGVTLAGVYPPGMKFVATWSKSDRGLGIGILVGALTLGSAVPHLLNALPILGEDGMPPWRAVLYASSVAAAVGGLVSLVLVRSGPLLPPKVPFNWRFAAVALRGRPTRLINFGYLGHMWELFAVWTWVPICLVESYQRAGWDIGAARIGGFAVVGVGALGCVVAGALADRLGRTATTIWSLVVSGLCCLLAGSLIGHPAALTVLCLVWGFAVVADSAQFSAGVSELTDPRYVGTALAIQTSLGFLLTLLTIRLIPTLVGIMGWERVFLVLAIGPALGIWAMARLRGLDEARRMASGNR